MHIGGKCFHYFGLYKHFVVHYVTLLVAVESNQYVFYRNEEGNLITKYNCIIFSFNRMNQ